MFSYVSDLLNDVAVVTKLPRDAGRSDEILNRHSEWPLEEQDLIHLYSGHRDLAFGPDGRPYVGPEQFKTNIEKIICEILRRSSARIVVSNIPPVSEGFLKIDPDRNRRIELYNGIIVGVASKLGVPWHDFWSFISSFEGGETKYIDGLHFTRSVYHAFAKILADYLLSETERRGPRR
jgi:lysophospholipase L1-like esterase